MAVKVVVFEVAHFADCGAPGMQAHAEVEPVAELRLEAVAPGVHALADEAAASRAWRQAVGRSTSSPKIAITLSPMNWLGTPPLSRTAAPTVAK